MFLYENKMLRGAWVDAQGTQYPAGWVDGATPEQLAGIGVVAAPDIPEPQHNPATQRAVRNEDGSWQVIDNAVDAIRDQVLTTLAAAYKSTIDADIEYTSAGGITKLFQADSTAVDNLQRSLSGCALTAATPPGFFWVASDNTQVPFTYADMQGLAAAMFSRGAVEFAKLQGLKAQARAAQGKAELDEIVW
jgi:hypothetical protein